MYVCVYIYTHVCDQVHMHTHTNLTILKNLPNENWVSFENNIQTGL